MKRKDCSSISSFFLPKSKAREKAEIKGKSKADGGGDEVKGEEQHTSDREIMDDDQTDEGKEEEVEDHSNEEMEEGDFQQDEGGGERGDNRQLSDSDRRESEASNISRPAGPHGMETAH